MTNGLHERPAAPSMSERDPRSGPAASGKEPEGTSRTVSYCLRIAPHYSGLISAHFPDFPGLVVLGRDHEEAKDLALAALEQELERLISQDELIPKPRTKGRLTISTRRPR